MFTMPVILKSPTWGRDLFIAEPGWRGLDSSIILPTFWILPKQASIAIVKGLVYLEFISFIILEIFLACTGYWRFPYNATPFLTRNFNLSPTMGPKLSPVDLSVPIHSIIIVLLDLTIGNISLLILSLKVYIEFLAAGSIINF